jgi:hypothetical protein
MPTGPELHKNKPALPLDPAPGTDERRLPSATLVGIQKFEETAQLVADAHNKPVVICQRPSDAPFVDKVPFKNLFKDDFEADAQGMTLVKVIHPSASHTPSQEVIATVNSAVAALPIEQGDAVTKHFGLDGSTPTQAPGATDDFLQTLRSASANPEGNALIDFLGQPPVANEPDAVTEALRSLRRPSSGK